MSCLHAKIYSHLDYPSVSNCQWGQIVTFPFWLRFEVMRIHYRLAPAGWGCRVLTHYISLGQTECLQKQFWSRCFRWNLDLSNYTFSLISGWAALLKVDSANFPFPSMFCWRLLTLLGPIRSGIYCSINQRSGAISVRCRVRPNSAEKLNPAAVQHLTLNHSSQGFCRNHSNVLTVNLCQQSVSYLF